MTLPNKPANKSALPDCNWGIFRLVKMGIIGMYIQSHIYFI